MRLFLYVSKATELHRLSGILNRAKTNNRHYGITGIMSYKQGFYLQAIEGSDTQVNDLVNNIRQDPRHNDMQTILDVETDHRYFTGWAMNLSPLLSRNREFKSMMADMACKLLKLPASVKMRADVFFKEQSAKSVPRSIEQQARRKPVNKPGLGVLGYEVTHWPNFNRLQASPQMLTLCGTLLNSPTSYVQLKKQMIFADEEALKESLRQIREAGCLNLCRLEEASSDHQKDSLQQSQAPSTFGFVERMRDFLRAQSL